MATSRMGKNPLAKNKESLNWMASTDNHEEKETEAVKIGRPKSIKRQISKSSQEGLLTGWTRATFIVNEDHLSKLKAIAYWDRKSIKDVLNNDLDAYFKGKDVKDIPCQ